MVSFEIRQWSRAARILMLGAIAAPHTSFPQPAFEPVATDERQRLIVARIQEELTQNGPLSAGLIEPWQALALLYQEAGDLVLAAAAVEQARQVVRTNYGLYSLEEAPLIRQAMRSAETLGDVAAAWDLEQQLLTLAERHPHDLRTTEILREVAGKRIDLLTRYLAGENPPQIVLGCYYERHVYDVGDPRRNEGWRSCHAGSKRVVVGSILAEALAYYTSAIDTVLRNDGHSSAELRELQTELFRTAYRYRDNRMRAYTDVNDVLHRILAEQSVSSGSALSRINTLVAIADWSLLFARYPGEYESALEVYGQAYELANEGAEHALAREIFSPRVPVRLPTFVPSPLVSQQTAESTGHIDVAFDITKHGTTDRIVVLDTSTNATRAAEKDLVRLIGRSRFRPRVTAGQIADSTPMVVRYYLSD